MTAGCEVARSPGAAVALLSETSLQQSCWVISCDLPKDLARGLDASLLASMHWNASAWPFAAAAICPGGHGFSSYLEGTVAGMQPILWLRVQGAHSAL